MKRGPIAAVLAAFALGAAVAWIAAGRVPSARASGSSSPPAPSDEAGLVGSLLAENLSRRTFSFARIAEASSGKRVLPLADNPVHQRVLAAIEAALTDCLATLNRDDSPVRALRRINEASRFFEDGLLERLDAQPAFRCEIPPNRDGKVQRSGYPDLRLTDLESGLVFYLDPKLVEQSSLASTLRTFYFEPKEETLKITDAAVHLLIGIEHDGRAGRWTFLGWHLVDLSTLQVRLKAEFQASNAELYRQPVRSRQAGND
jgi:hypothetical protein